MDLVRPQSWLLCASWRTGSTNLGDIVRRTLGVPVDREPLWEWNSGRERPIGERQEESLAAIQAAVDGKASGSDGRMAAKLMWRDVVLAASSVGWRRENIRGFLESLFPQPRYVLVSRQDKIRQAVSLWRARETQVLHGEVNGRVHRGSRPAREARYSFAGISAALRDVRIADAEWRSYFAKYSLEHLELSYEEICRDWSRSAQRAVEWWQGRAAKGGFQSPRFVRLADEETERWVRRYQRDYRQRSGEADPS